MIVEGIIPLSPQPPITARGEDVANQRSPRITFLPNKSILIQHGSCVTVTSRPATFLSNRQSSNVALMNIWLSLFPHSADSHSWKHAWLHKLMAAAYDFMLLNRISETGQSELQPSRGLPETNGFSVTAASEPVSAARCGLLFAGQGHGLDFSPHSSILKSGFSFSCLWWPIGELPREFQRQPLPNEVVNCH